MRVTIGIPVLNGARTLGDAIRSVFAQSFSDWELIIADDGSTDGTEALVKSVRDSRVRWMSDGTQRRLPFRLNQIAAAAQGEFLARMDADDLMHPERIAKQVAFLDAHPRVNVLGTAAVTINGSMEPVGTRGLSQASNAVAAEILAKGLFIHPSVMFRTTWAQAHPYDVSVPRAEDYELWVRTSKTGELSPASLPDTLLFYRECTPVNLKAYLATCRDAKVVLRRYGPDLVGNGRTSHMVARKTVNGWLYRGAQWLGQDARLVARRNSPLTREATEEVRRVLSHIRSTHVPGMPEVGA